MRHPIATAAALAITAIVTACGGKDNATPVEDVTVQAGRYEGVFPAAYGPGTDVMLDLMTDGSFVVVMSMFHCSALCKLMRKAILPIGSFPVRWLRVWVAPWTSW